MKTPRKIKWANGVDEESSGIIKRKKQIILGSLLKINITKITKKRQISLLTDKSSRWNKYFWVKYEWMMRDFKWWRLILAHSAGLWQASAYVPGFSFFTFFNSTFSILCTCLTNICSISGYFMFYTIIYEL